MSGRPDDSHIKVRIKAPGAEIEVTTEPGARLDDVIMSSGLLLDRPCAGRGSCGKCAVRVSGALSEADERERSLLEKTGKGPDVRLACRARVQGDVSVDLPASAVFTDKTFSSGEDLDEVQGELGLALDLGTTTVAALVVGLDDGRVHAGHAVLNLQASVGAEVMGRLDAREHGRTDLAGLAWQSLAQAAAGLELSDRVRSRVRRAVVVANSAMHHLVLELPIDSLLRSPFEPYTNEASSSPPGELARLFPNLDEVWFAPLLGGFVGSDALACIAYFGLGRGESVLAMDLGTNGEIMVSRGDDVWVASTAAGPAFEGVNISCGMRASPGAVTKAEWSGGGLALTTVDRAPARGLAGSGLLSAVRTLYEHGLIEASGRMIDASSHEGAAIERQEGVKRVRLGPGLYLNQNDVRELQKAKSAVRSAAEILLERAGVPAGELERVILTGGFGGRLDPGDALALGVLPEVRPGRVHAIANGAGLGAALMLDPAERAAAGELAVRVRHVELNLDPSFMDRYVRYMALAG